MTAGVPRNAVPLPADRVLQIAQPYTAPIAATFVARIAHLLGHHLPTVHEQGFGTTESGTATYRFQHHSSRNARAIVLKAIPHGLGALSGSSGIFTGTLDMPGAETVTPTTWAADEPANLTDLQQSTLWFVKTVTPNTLQEHTYVTVNLRLHSVTAYEVPLAVLEAAHYHLHRSHAEPRLYITDDASTPDPRGVEGMLDSILQARIDMRRHLVSMYWNAGTVTSGASGYVLGSATAGDGLRVFPRAVMGNGVASGVTPGRGQVYVSAMTAANTFTFSFNFDGTLYTTAGIAAASVPGWFDANPGLTMSMPNTSAGSLFKLQFTRTGGSGTATVNGCSVRENVT